MQFTRALTALEARLQTKEHPVPARGLGVPPNWRGDRPLWARIVAHARLYASCRAAYFDTSNCDAVVARLFDDLAQTAELISRGGSLYALKTWVSTPEVRSHQDARAVRNLINIIESLDVF